MRRIGITVAVVATSLSVAGIAQAVDVTQGLTTKTTGKKGTKKRPSGLKLSVVTTTNAKDPAQDGQYATKSAVIHFDKNLKFYPKNFPTCSLSVAASDASKCPKGSLVGTGGASAIVGAVQIKANPTIQAFNATGGKLILKLTKAANEVDSSGILTGTLKKDSGSKYGMKLVVPIPPQLQNQLGLDVTLTRFETNIKKSAKKKGHYYVESIGCSGKSYKFGGDFVYSDNSSQKVTATSKC